MGTSNPNLADEAAHIIMGGGTVVIVQSDPSHARSRIVDGIVAHMDESARYRRANGDERIEHPSGGLALNVHMNQLHRLRGVDAEYAVLDGCELLAIPAVRRALFPCFATKGRRRIAVVA